MRHPHSEATYRVVPFDGTAFAVEVTIPDTNPTMVSAFATQSDAEDWIAEHKRRVESPVQPRRWHRRAATGPA